MYMIIVTANKKDEMLVNCTVKIEKFKNNNEVLNYCTDLLTNSDIAYIHTQPSTYNNYINAEVKTLNDYSVGVYEQVRYTKNKQYCCDSVCCKTVMI